MVDKIPMPHGGAIPRARKGETANPHGRPKGSKNLRNLLEKYLADLVTLDDVKGATNVTKYDAIVMQLIKKAAEGDLPAMKEIFDRLEGKAAQPIRDETHYEPPNDDEVLRQYNLPIRGESNNDGSDKKESSQKKNSKGRNPGK